MMFDNHSCVAAYLNSSGVYLALRSSHINNNSNINIRNIGQTSNNPNDALQCVTDNLRCCRQNPRLGEWYLPSGALVQGTASITAFYRSRGDNGEVSLNRPSSVESPTGLFCCEVPDATNINQTLCVNIGIIINLYCNVQSMYTMYVPLTLIMIESDDKANPLVVALHESSMSHCLTVVLA